MLDYTRGTRLNNKKDSNSSSKTLLYPLTKKGAQIAFYLSPEFSSFCRKRFLLPFQKFNEVVSLQHIKCYIFDDSIILSGANLSEQYFTNRQDRYICFNNSKELCDYFEKLVETVSSFSMQLNKEGSFVLHPSWSYHPLDSKQKSNFIKEAQNRIENLRTKATTSANTDCETFAIPVLQLKTFKINEDEDFTLNIFRNYPQGSSIKLATGYFNLTQTYQDVIFQKATSTVGHFSILMASERANGFYRGKGLSGWIPSFYTHFARKFLLNSKIDFNIRTRLSLLSYERSSWTFHAKGLWVTWNTPHIVTFIGSPNFGYRSVYRDLEAQLVLVTKNQSLKNELINECDIWKTSTQVENEDDLPQVPFIIRFISRLVKTYY